MSRFKHAMHALYTDERGFSAFEFALISTVLVLGGLAYIVMNWDGVVSFLSGQL